MDILVAIDPAALAAVPYRCQQLEDFLTADTGTSKFARTELTGNGASARSRTYR
jgi:hypothetical protein